MPFTSTLIMDHFFSNDMRAFIFVLLEFILFVMICFQGFFLLGINRVGLSLTFFNRIINPFEIVIFLFAIIFLVIIYYGIAVKDNRVIKVHKEFSKLVFGTAKQKVFGINKEIFVLVFFEFVFAIIIAIAIYIYLDPETSAPGMGNVPWPFNLVAFIAFLAFGLYVFSLTEPFRESIYGPSPIKAKVLPAKRLFPVRRITNKKRETIRIGHKNSFEKEKKYSLRRPGFFLKRKKKKK